MLAGLPIIGNNNIINSEKRVKSAMKIKNPLRRPMVATIDEGGVLEDSCETAQKVVKPSSSLSQHSRSTSTKDNTDSCSSADTLDSPKCEKKGKRIHWYHKVEKKRHPRVKDLTPGERESIWYTESDTKFILAMAKVTVKMMMRGEPCDDIDYCSRGLEGKTPEGSKRRQRNKLRVRQALLEEQEIQREEGVIDADYLGQLSVSLSREVTAEAHNTALQDERVAMEYLSIPDCDSNMLPPKQPMRRPRK